MLNQVEQAFLQSLPVGRENALTAGKISVAIGAKIGKPVSERRVRRIASDLRRRYTEHEVLIGSSPTEPYGFYVPASDREAERCAVQLAQRTREIGRTARDFRAAIAYRRLKAFAKQAEIPDLDLGA